MIALALPGQEWKTKTHFPCRVLPGNAFSYSVSGEISG
jgi:hypothetical protein